MFSADVRGEVPVAEQLEVLFHRFERLPVGRPCRVKDPSALRTPPTTKAWLVYPYQLTRHGGIIRRFALMTSLFPNE